MPLPPGVEMMDHTADVGITVRASSLADLFVAAGRALVAVIEEDGEEGGGAPKSIAVVETRTIQLTAVDTAVLLVDWLRELLYLYESRRLAFSDAGFETLTDAALTATVRFRPAGTPTREIKGVTYHQLELTRAEDVWTARVVFDV